MSGERARDRFATARVARLASVDPRAGTHIVPFVFAVVGDAVYSVVDDKPKSTRQLRRLDNVAHNPRVSALVDEYSEDWSRLWWVRADGVAHVAPAGSGEAELALTALSGRYPEYQHQLPSGPVLVIDVNRWSGWSAS
jgi:PPOX class probable F420-dependent enzyme